MACSKIHNKRLKIFRANGRHYKQYDICQKKTEHPAVLHYHKFIDRQLCTTMLEHFEDRLDLLRKSHFYIKIQPKKISIRRQNIKTLLLLDPRRLEHLKEMGRDQVMIKMFLLENYLEEMRKSCSELVDMLQSNQGEFSLTKQETINESLSGLLSCIFGGTAPLFNPFGRMFTAIKKKKKLVNDFKNMSVHDQLHFKHQLISPTEVRHHPSLRLFLNFKQPVMFDRVKSRAADDWANLSWQVSGRQHLTESFDLHFRQINTPPHVEADSGLINVDGNKFKIEFLLPQETYEFTIRRTKESHTVHDEWCDVLTLRIMASGAQPTEIDNTM
ncbi:fibronectin type III domain-containing protein 11-like [Rana temporaria]|uniref:fibronectin type III domain-containing protein 11-like n=1 Tax=Rana temporaria TaxID=8407 RepID=UPI001AADE19A|nr:fibronectin type III domain-containing protein 11-like [Rana temporaria]